MLTLRDHQLLCRSAVQRPPDPRQVRIIADATRTGQDDVLGARDERGSREIGETATIELGDGGEVKAGQRLGRIHTGFGDAP